MLFVNESITADEAIKNNLALVAFSGTGSTSLMLVSKPKLVESLEDHVAEMRHSGKSLQSWRIGRSDTVVAYIDLEKYGGTWWVALSAAVSGYGTLIYDMALVVAGGDGLTSDTSVSEGAIRVWSKFRVNGDKYARIQLSRHNEVQSKIETVLNCGQASKPTKQRVGSFWSATPSDVVNLYSWVEGSLVDDSLPVADKQILSVLFKYKLVDGAQATCLNTYGTLLREGDNILDECSEITNGELSTSQIREKILLSSCDFFESRYHNHNT